MEFKDLIRRDVASLSLPGGQDKNISSIFPHFPEGSFIFLKFSSFSSSFWSSPTREGPGYATVDPFYSLT